VGLSHLKPTVKNDVFILLFEAKDLYTLATKHLHNLERFFTPSCA
jgi:hypothetical protein